MRIADKNMCDGTGWYFSLFWAMECPGGVPCGGCTECHGDSLLAPIVPSPHGSTFRAFIPYQVDGNGYRRSDVKTLLKSIGLVFLGKV